MTSIRIGAQNAFIIRKFKKKKQIQTKIDDFDRLLLICSYSKLRCKYLNIKRKKNCCELCSVSFAVEIGGEKLNEILKKRKK